MTYPTAYPAARGRLSISALPAIAGALAFTGALLYALHFHLRVEVLPFDDAFITYRYVDNLLAGHGLVYNVSERIFGSTTPLYTFWLAGLKTILPGISVPALAVRGNAIFYLASAALVVALTYRWLRLWSPAFLLGAVFAVNPEMLVTSSGGMEPFLFLSLALGTLLALAYGRIRLAALLAGCCMVTRPEGALLAGIWFLCWLLWDRKRDWLALGLVAAPLLAWVVFATLYFGTPVPESIVAKNSSLYRLAPGTAWGVMLQRFVEWSGVSRLGEVPSDWWWVLGTVPALIGSAALLRPGSPRRDGAWTLPVMFWSLAAFYARANAIMFDWYYPLLYAPWLMLVAVGPLSLVVPGKDRVAARSAAWRALSWALVCVGILAIAAQPLWSSVELWMQGLPGPAVATADRERVRAYLSVIAALKARGQAPLTLAAPEVGTLGYYYDGHIYDACGLVSPQALPFLPVPMRERTSGAAAPITAGFVEATDPDYVVTMPTLSQKSIAVNAWFARNYRVVDRVPLPQELWGSTEVLVYGREPRAAAASAVPLDTAWGDGITLKRAWLPVVKPGDVTVPVSLVWASRQKPAENWTVFVHLIDSRGHILGQGDGDPDRGNAPTTAWEGNDVVVDLHEIRVERGLSPGTYRLVAGLYDRVTGARLPLASGGDSLELPELVVGGVS